MSEFNPLPIHASVLRAGTEPGPKGTDASGSQTAGDMEFAEVLAKQAGAFAELGTPIVRAEPARSLEPQLISGGKELPVPTGLPLPISSAEELELPEALVLQSHPGRASQATPDLPLPIPSASELELPEALVLQSHPGRASQATPNLPLPIPSASELELPEALVLQFKPSQASLKPNELVSMGPGTPNGEAESGEKLDLKPLSTTMAQLLIPEHRQSGRGEGLVVQNSLSGEFTPLIANASHSPLPSDILALKPLRLSIPVPTSGLEWDSAFSNRVAWMVNRNVQIAELQLYPPELGRVEVRISLQNGTADIHFGAQHVTAREAIESALPRLKETLSEGGLGTVTVDVSRHALTDGRSGGFQNANKQYIPGTPLSDVPTDEERIQEAVFWTHDGLIDHYA